MARKIIILDRQNLPSDQDYRVVFWLDVPLARQPYYQNVAATSHVVGATQAELDAIKSGAVVERVEIISIRANATLGQIQAGLAARHGGLQAELTSRNPWARYGSSWDGTNWSMVTVA